MTITLYCHLLFRVFTSHEVKFGLKIQSNEWGNHRNLYHKTNKEASTVLCSVAKHLGQAVEHTRSRKKHSTSLVFSLTSFVVYHIDFLGTQLQRPEHSRGFFVC